VNALRSFESGVSGRLDCVRRTLILQRQTPRPLIRRPGSAEKQKSHGVRLANSRYCSVLDSVA